MFSEMNQFITIAAVITFLFQIIFIINFIYSAYKGKIVKTANPWGATTLEWTTPFVVPGHNNWIGEMPTVHRWAYDYGKGGMKNLFLKLLQ